MYHVDCFRCEACRKCLQTGDGKRKKSKNLVFNKKICLIEFTLSGDNRILCRNDYDSLTNNNSDDKLKPLDCQKLLNADLGKVNNENPVRQNSLLQRKKSSRISSNNKIISSIDGMDSNDERHKSTDDSSSLSPNGSSSQLNSSNNNAERRPRRDKQQRVRTVLTEKQLHLLKSCYAYNARPDALLKEQLAEMTELSPRVIRVWFQNKRKFFFP
jgi:hypothetical protein